MKALQTKGGVEKGGGVGWEEEEVMADEDGSDMEGWEDDGWGSIDEKEQPQQNPSTVTPPPSSGADFFDTFQHSISSKPKEKDYFADFGFTDVKASTYTSAKKEKTPPPLVSAALFGGGEKKTESRSDGWGDWGSDFSSAKPQVRMNVACVH